MFELKSSLLSAVIPITDLETRVDFLRKWLGKVPPEIQLVMIYDLRPGETRSALFDEVISIHENTMFAEGFFGGPGPARNYGLTLADAPYVAFWDSDDVPELCSQIRMLQVIYKSDFDVIIGGYSRRNLGTDQINFKSPKPETWEKDVALELGIWRMIFRKSFLQQVQFPSIRLGEDQVFFLRVLQLSPRVFAFSERVYEYTSNTGKQLTSKKSIRILDLRLTLEAHEWNSSINKPAFMPLSRMMHMKLLMSFCRRLKFKEIPKHSRTILSHFYSVVFIEKIRLREFLTLLLAAMKGIH
jgi:glycosyltransferase involved in cell wall biosynthesis